MRIIVDENIAYAREAFSEFGEVMQIQGRLISNALLKSADALVVRSVTQVNEALLRNTNLVFIGSATIGTDHIDRAYLKEKGIIFSDAKGCNADAVAEYVLTAIFHYTQRFQRKLKDLSIGIIGVGTIGSKIEKYAEAFGMKVIPNDPPLQEETNDPKYRTLEEALQADIITIHAPLTLKGKHATHNLINESNLNNIREGSLFINTARGPLIETDAFLRSMEEKEVCIALDVWENEPNIYTGLLARADFATPHIAGYTLEGKVNGTKMIYDRFALLMGHEQKWEPNLPAVKQSGIVIDSTLTREEIFAQVLLQIYDIQEDTLHIKSMLNMPEMDRVNFFDRLRRNYRLRREYTNYRIYLEPYDEALYNLFGLLRFG